MAGGMRLHSRPGIWHAEGCARACAFLDQRHFDWRATCFGRVCASLGEQSAWTSGANGSPGARVQHREANVEITCERGPAVAADGACPAGCWVEVWRVKLWERRLEVQNAVHHPKSLQVSLIST